MDKGHYRVARLDGTSLHAFVISHSDCASIGTVIFVHGFLGEGCENHRMFMRMADAVAATGYNCVLYDQKGCGYSDGAYDDVRLKDIVEDLITITAWVRNRFEGRIGYLGQSLGSALVLSALKALKPAFVVTVNPVADFASWLTKRYDWDLSTGATHYYAFPKGILVSRAFIEDLLSWDWLSNLDIVSLPMLIIAAGADDINSLETARAVAARLGDNVQLNVVEGANHSFTGQGQLETVAVKDITCWLMRICRVC